jgi:hypothetical protein
LTQNKSKGSLLVRPVKTVAFETNLIAIRQLEGRFDVVSDTIAHIDLDALRKENRIVDVSDDTGYVDRAAILSHGEFPRYLLPDPWSKKAREWYAALPKHVRFILVNESEWERGLGE